MQLPEPSLDRALPGAGQVDNLPDDTPPAPAKWPFGTGTVDGLSVDYQGLACLFDSMHAEQDSRLAVRELELSMSTFAEVVDAADKLSADEQESLLGILRRRIAETNRAQLADDVAEARAEFVSGRARSATVQQIMDEACREP